MLGGTCYNRAMLIDDLRAARTGRLPYEADCLDRAIVFRVDDAARYVEGLGYPQPISGTDLPNVAPLAQIMWMEWTSVNFGDWQRAALIVNHYDLAVEEEQRWMQEDHAAMHGQEPLPAWMAGVRWLSTLYAHRARGADVHILEDTMRLYIRSDGTLQGLDYDALHDPQGEHAAQVSQWITHSTLVALTATCFAHCKGVTTTEHAQPRQQRRAAERAGRPPLVRYKTIDIVPVTRLLKDEGHVETSGIKRALHITRGHFAHYTDEAPLFGKYTGTFYRPLHVRGRRGRGAVIKDYRILSPEVHP